MMKKIVIFGGTFNPVHKGHRQMLDALSGIKDVDKVYVIPTKTPPHKETDFLADEQQRLYMCKLLSSHYNNVEVCDIELKRTGKSYTIDTLRAFKERFPDSSLYITIGADSVVSFTKWKNYEEILKNAGLICFSRGDISTEQYACALDELKRNGAQILVLSNSIENISSTKIRNALKSKDDAKQYLDSDIYNYITENRIYGE